MSRTTVLNRPQAARADDSDGLSLVDLGGAGVSLVEPFLPVEGGREVGAGPAPVAPVGLGIPTVRTPMTPEELQQASWQDRALCSQTDPEAFFPEKGGSTREAKRVCLGCEVRRECLEYALTHDERFGIWGGLSERERRRVKREAV